MEKENKKTKISEKLWNLLYNLTKDTGRIGWDVTTLRSYLAEEQPSLVYGHVWSGFYKVMMETFLRKKWAFYNEDNQQIVLNTNTEEIIEMIKEIKEAKDKKTKI